MKNKSGRIPIVADMFNTYINNTESYLRLTGSVPTPSTSGGQPVVNASQITNWQRLGMIQTEMDAWTGFKNQWNALFVKYSDKEESRTTAITNKLHLVQSNFRLFAQPILTMIAGVRTVNDDDAAVFNIVIHRADPTHPVTPIDQMPTFSATPLGGAEIKFSFRPTHDSTRASKLTGATGLELRYSFTDAPDGISLVSSTKSIFILNLPENSKGKTLHVSARWIVATDPRRNGPWSSTLSVVVA